MINISREENFYRCQKCNHPYFYMKEIVAIKKDPISIPLNQIETREANTKEGVNSKKLYFCEQCDERLDRVALTRIEQEKDREKRLKQKMEFPNSPF